MAGERAVRRLLRGFTPGTWLATGWLALVAAAAVVGPLLPLDVARVDLTKRAAAPSWQHPLGTTRRGADLLALVVDGTRRSLAVGVGAAALAIALGATAGLVVGYRQGWIDRVVVLVADTMLALPGLAVALVASLVLGTSKASLTALIGVLLAPGVFRIVRAVARAQAGLGYVTAARSLGARAGRILTRELLPNTVVPLAAYGFVVVGIAMLIEGALAFLGIGGGPASTSWGALIAAGQGSLERSPHLALGPALVLIATLVAFTVVGEGLQRDGLRPLRTVPAPKAATAVAGPPGGPAEHHASLAVRELSAVYHTVAGALPVLDGVSLTVHAGHTLAIVGESGSGKSTLVRAVLGLLPANGEITAGSIRLDGEELRGRSPAELAAVRGRRIALVMQQPTTALHPMRTVGSQLSEPMRLLLGLSANDARARALELLERVAVPDPARRLRQYPFQLSGGVAQRVCVALALSCRPTVLVADEPTSSLDTTVAAEVLNLLDELKASMGLAIVLVSHSLDLVASRADDVLVLHAGRVAELATAVQLFSTPRMPYTQALLAAVPRVTDPSHTRLGALPSGVGTLGLLAPGCTFAPRCSRVDDHCRREVPPLAADADGHAVACWHAG